jgi:phosphoribosylanthranilate isomerase
MDPSSTGSDPQREVFLSGPGRLFVKICGITRAEDALAAVDAGADALGFNLFPGSKRHIDVSRHADWIRGLQGSIQRLAVMVNPTFDNAAAVAHSGLFDAIQFHGAESIEFCSDFSKLNFPFAKALRIASGERLTNAAGYRTNIVFLDTFVPGEFGGTGQLIDVLAAANFIRANASLRTILSGGLNPDNVSEAVHATQPFGVDVASGVDTAPGRKDATLIRRFIEAARSVAAG